MKKKLIIVGIVVLLLAVAVGGTALYFKHTIDVQNRTIETLVNQEPQVVEKEKIIEKEVEITSVTIRDGLRDIGKLCTAEYYFTHVTTFDSQKQINGFIIPLTKSSFVYSYDGTIYAGIDFTKITVEKNDVDKVIIITLPPVEIISAEVDPDSFRLYDEKSNIFNPIKVTDVTDSFTSLLAEEKDKAVEKGLYDRAKANAEQLITNFMKMSFNLNEYNVIIN